MSDHLYPRFISAENLEETAQRLDNIHRHLSIMEGLLSDPDLATPEEIRRATEEIGAVAPMLLHIDRRLMETGLDQTSIRFREVLLLSAFALDALSKVKRLLPNETEVKGGEV